MNRKHCNYYVDKLLIKHWIHNILYQKLSKSYVIKSEQLTVLSFFLGADGPSIFLVIGDITQHSDLQVLSQKIIISVKILRVIHVSVWKICITYH